jgi:hypothetical protein
MNEWLMKQADGSNFRNRRLGVALALVAALYVAAVIAFIVLY